MSDSYFLVKRSHTDLPVRVNESRIVKFEMEKFENLCIASGDILRECSTYVVDKFCVSAKHACAEECR